MIADFEKNITQLLSFIGLKYENNLKIKFYDGWIPEETEKPNFGTLLFELYKF